jgi:hypothetical protein
VSLRYLFCKGEEHRLLPTADPVESGIKVTNEQTQNKGVDATISGFTPATLAPKLEAHITTEGKVHYEQEGQKSWRSGLTLESCTSISQLSLSNPKARCHAVVANNNNSISPQIPRITTKMNMITTAATLLSSQTTVLGFASAMRFTITGTHALTKSSTIKRRIGVGKHDQICHSGTPRTTRA